MRGGRYNIPSLLDLAAWAQEERAHIDHYGLEMARLRTHFEQKICNAIPDATPIFQEQLRVPHITSLCFPGVASDSLYFLLLQKGIYTTFGGGHFQHFSHILKASGIDEFRALCALSSFSSFDEEEEIKKGLRRLLQLSYSCRNTHNNSLLRSWHELRRPD